MNETEQHLLQHAARHNNANRERENTEWVTCWPFSGLQFRWRISWNQEQRSHWMHITESCQHTDTQTVKHTHRYTDTHWQRETHRQTLV